MLIGTASTWFLLDIAFYSQNLFLPNILEGIGYNPSITLPISKAACAKTHSCTTFDQQARARARAQRRQWPPLVCLLRLCRLVIGCSQRVVLVTGRVRLVWLAAVHFRAGRER